MKFTLRWLQEHIAIDLPPAQIGHRLTMAGLELDGLWDLQQGDSPAATLGHQDDWLFDVAITPNRGDCLSIRGIARELAVLTNRPLLPLAIRMTEEAAIGRSHPVTILIEDQTGCPRYAGRVMTGVRVGPSPAWLQQRLETVGLRAINNVVDCTNLVMWELGQPLHAFDWAKLAPPVVIRAACDGELLRTLDGIERRLDSEMTLIADQARPLALAGIMGGEDSGVTEDTTTIFLESAFFHPVRVARTGRSLGLTSDSRYRFERGVDPEGLRIALDRACHLIQEVAGGSAGPVQYVDGGSWQPVAAIPYRHDRIVALSGLDLGWQEADRLLTGIGCQPLPPGSVTPPGHYQPPSHRHDLTREEDLLEEVVRLYGYDRIPVSLPRPAIEAPTKPPLEALTRLLRLALAGAGYLESINYAFVSQELQQVFDPEIAPLILVNPLSAEQAVMRTSLIPGLVDAARRNLSRGNRRLRLFESGRIFHQQADGSIIEQEELAGLLTGPAHEPTWHTPTRENDFFDLKGDLTGVLALLRSGIVDWRPGGPEFLHPGQKATIHIQRQGAMLSCGWLGRLHPQWQERLDLPQPIWLFALALDWLLGADPDPDLARPVSRFPAVERDFAFAVPVAVPAGALLAEIRRIDPELIRQVTLFDLYTGVGIVDDRKGLGVRVLLKSDDRTLTEQELLTIAERIIQTASDRFEATLRF